MSKFGEDASKHIFRGRMEVVQLSGFVRETSHFEIRCMHSALLIQMLSHGPFFIHLESGNSIRLIEGPGSSCCAVDKAWP